MRQKNLQTALSALVAECGYASVIRSLEKMRPKDKGADVVTPPPNNKEPAKKPRVKKDAVAVVASLDLPEGEKKRALVRLAERYENKTFMPNVNHVRAFLEGMGMDVSRIKSRQQVTVRVFKHLADMPEGEVQDVEHSGCFDPPKSLDVIADAIHAFGRRQRQEERRSS